MRTNIDVMENLSVDYMGLKLRSPFIAGSCGFTSKIDNLIALDKAGAGAVVLKSLFEEQISDQAAFLNEQSAFYPENLDYLHYYLQEYSLENYLNLIRSAKRYTGIPVIASINCYHTGSWISFAKEIESAGADGLEINIYSLPLTKLRTSDAIEDEYLGVVTSLTKELKIPVAVKIGSGFTSLPGFVNSLKICGAAAVVMFNKYYHPDIDIKNLKITGANPFSREGDYVDVLRWVAITSSIVGNLDISASTGVLSADDAVKMILAGANTVQLCSALYKYGTDHVDLLVNGLRTFMLEKGFNSLDSFRGMMNYSNIHSPEKYERVQFLKTFGSHTP